jgi:histidinol phosphatase-like PHP family hydrolase
LIDDKDIVLEAVKKDGGALEYASEKLKDDKDIVLEAVKKDGFNLLYASGRF